MGWDAYAIRPTGNKPLPRAVRDAFRAASDEVARLAGTADGLLKTGGLDCSACAYALEEATGRNAWDENDWEPEFVKTLASRAAWPEMIDVPPDKAWAVWSARKFLETCAAHGLRITFSW